MLNKQNSMPFIYLLQSLQRQLIGTNFLTDFWKSLKIGSYFNTAETKSVIFGSKSLETVRSMVNSSCRNYPKIPMVTKVITLIRDCPKNVSSNRES